MHPVEFEWYTDLPPTLHTVNEYVDIDDLVRTAQILALSALALTAG
ncbi:hypothetical protein LVY72_11400 [Arthrobacter sp. I2-34]|uniref:Uncharacterized protein n=1 Tax=Arthrobacter hankyongi TaxID=2904801 RepID=A0ABS9L7N2_9MICC|nr:hypothetical protein [Arthrobacter hankyongi]MCG2622518.1 hypothetical protein [Arthrobacter hankyongi]